MSPRLRVVAAVGLGAAVSVLGLAVVVQLPLQSWARIDHVALALLQFALMLAGIFAHEIYAEAIDRKTAGQPMPSVAELLRRLSSEPRLWIAILVSPLVFHSVHVWADQAPSSSTGAFFAFQNGFFWQTVFGKLQTLQAQAPPGAAAVQGGPGA